MSRWGKRRKDVAEDPVAWTDPEGAVDDDEPAGATAALDGDDAEPSEESVFEDPSPSGNSDRTGGPWDRSEVEAEDGYVDLGALWLRGREGMELRLELDEQSQQVTAATVQMAESAVQLQVFAAPRTTGIWDEIRAEIADGIVRQGGSADEVPGPFGRELLAQVPVRTADGATGRQAARFAGVDGPRWFLRAVFHGAAAYQAEAAELLESVVREVVVVRGADAMAPRELLALRLPEQAAPVEAEVETPERPPLDPFTRGPEITEIR